MLKNPLLQRAKGSSPPSSKQFLVVTPLEARPRSHLGGRILLMTNSSHFQIKPSQEIVLHCKLQQFTDMAAILRNEEIEEGQIVEKKGKQQESQREQQQQQRKMK